MKDNNKALDNDALDCDGGADADIEEAEIATGCGSTVGFYSVRRETKDGICNG